MSKNTQKIIGGGFDLENVDSHNLNFFILMPNLFLINGMNLKVE